jgi:hypothetical protein
MFWMCFFGSTIMKGMLESNCRRTSNSWTPTLEELRKQGFIGEPNVLIHEDVFYRIIHEVGKLMAYGKLSFPSKPQICIIMKKITCLYKKKQGMHKLHIYCVNK